MSRFTIVVKNDKAAAARIDEIARRLKQPKNGLIRATNKVAQKFGENFDSEGGLVGGWPDLAEQTQGMREWQGFSPDHPILIRYGALRAVAVEFFQNAKGSGSVSKGDSYSDEVVKGSLSLRGQTARLYIGGSYKVMNQFGYPDTNGSGVNPPRPFWFVNKHSIAAARDGVKEWIEDEVLKG